MQENQFLLFLNHLRLPYSIPKSFALLLNIHVARHSWASIARDKNIPLSIISESMGHESEMTTRIYLSTIDHHEIDRANRIILQSI